MPLAQTIRQMGTNNWAAFSIHRKKRVLFVFGYCFVRTMFGMCSEASEHDQKESRTKHEQIPNKPCSKMQFGWLSSIKSSGLFARSPGLKLPACPLKFQRRGYGKFFVVWKMKASV